MTFADRLAAALMFPLYLAALALFGLFLIAMDIGKAPTRGE